jgi:hypothetical protein
VFRRSVKAQNKGGLQTSHAVQEQTLERDATRICSAADGWDAESGAGWPRRSRPGTGSLACSQIGGPRAVIIDSGRFGSPTEVKICAPRTTSLTKASVPEVALPLSEQERGRKMRFRFQLQKQTVKGLSISRVLVPPS